MSLSIEQKIPPHHMRKGPLVQTPQRTMDGDAWNHPPRWVMLHKLCISRVSVFVLNLFRGRPGMPPSVYVCIGPFCSGRWPRRQYQLPGGIRVGDFVGHGLVLFFAGYFIHICCGPGENACVETRVILQIHWEIARGLNRLVGSKRNGYSYKSSWSAKANRKMMILVLPP